MAFQLCCGGGGGGIGEQAASYAIRAVNEGPFGARSVKLAGLMCWDAVARCNQKGGAGASGPITGGDSRNLVTTGDPGIGDHSAMRRAPLGASIGFFQGQRLLHAMIATGQGCAAGNKNACLGIGNAVGWEILNLAEELQWNGSGASIAGYGSVSVHYRSLDF